jgi:hypothetical protein
MTSEKNKFAPQMRNPILNAQMRRPRSCAFADLKSSCAYSIDEKHESEFSICLCISQKSRLPAVPRTEV